MDAEALHEGRAIFAVDLHPSFAGNALQGVRQEMESRLLRWDAGLEGVLLAYRNLNRLPSEAPIRPYFPYIALRVAADVLVFRPKKDAVLCGQVTKIGADFIGMTLLGSINAAVGRQNIRARLQHDPEAMTWRTPGKPDSTIEVGSDVIFTVERLRIDSHGTPAVLGAMRQPWTGAARAAAQRMPTAFPDPHRWQRMQPLSQTIRMFDAEPEPAATPSGPASWQLPAAATPADATASPKPPKKKRKRDSAAAAAAPEAAATGADAAGASNRAEPEPAAPAAAEHEAEQPGTAEGGKKKKKKRRREEQPLANGITAVPENGPAAAGGGQAEAPSSAEPKKKKRKRDSLQPGGQDGPADGQAAGAAGEGQPEPHRKKKKRRASEGAAAAPA